ncbi:sodium-coupled monocarboxylate transporter 1 [Elysia marginata]|uniref:Sodium-coupled monocarboxylate transporter 1 n=1 Tax=Elysia marginata TaxID=1093978 RepID=A0AAV4EAN9_9GAST|nr:sodium-coupled monocarboxylate transporter 1 [Elysia marginata]
MSSHENSIQFDTADYVLLSLMLGGSLGIGLYMARTGKKNTTQADYLLGGRRMTAIPVCLSLFATFQSAISLLGIPTEVYIYGTMMIYGTIGLSLSYPLAMVTTIPLMYPLGVTSINEYLSLRYRCKSIQVIGAVIGVFSNLAYMTVALLSPALALETAVGIPLWMSIFLVGAVGTAYTTLGGMKSVVWTDVFQSVVIFAGIFTVLVKGTMDAGGVDKVWQIGKDSGRIKYFDMSLDPRVRHTSWNQVIGYVVFWLGVHFTQPSVQRLISTSSIQEANKVYLYTIPVVVIYNVVLFFTGLAILAYFFTLGCDPIAGGLFDNKNQLVPYFVLHALRLFPGLPGLYISTIFSGALSTLSSGINSMSANVVQDFLAKFLQGMPERMVTTITKLLVCFFGVVIAALAYLAKEFEGPVSQLSYTVGSTTKGPLLGLFLLSGLFPQANYIGAIFGLASGLGVGLWKVFGSLWFGYRTPILPPGPIHQCPVENVTVFNTTTPAYAISTDAAGLLMFSWTYNLTTSSVYHSTESSVATGLEDRAFSFYDVSYTLNPLITASVTLLAGLIASLVVRPFLREAWSPESKLLFPFCRRFWYSDMDVLSTEMQNKSKDRDLED